MNWAQGYGFDSLSKVNADNIGLIGILKKEPGETKLPRQRPAGGSAACDTAEGAYQYSRSWAEIILIMEGSK